MEKEQLKIKKSINNIESFRPVNDFIIAKQYEAREKKGAIYIPESAKKLEHFAIVISVGPGALIKDSIHRTSMSVRPNDTVIFQGNPDSPVIRFQVNEIEFLCFREKNVLAVLEEDENEQDKTNKEEK